MITNVRSATICVVGAGYVGLPLAKALAMNYTVASFDIDDDKVKRLSDQNSNPNHIFTTEAGIMADSDFIIVCVPTLLTEEKRLDVSNIKQAAAVIGRNMKRGAIIVLESSVYPGATEEVFKPALEEASGLECGKDFKLGYSPERISPGDLEHSVDRVAKIVSACDEDTLEKVADLYRHVTGNIFKAKSIKAAEAAKLVENTQRDVNIALINELSMLFEKIGIPTQDVLDAAATKWNFQKFSPGLVGGYCIPVAPYFLVQKAEENACRLGLVLSGRAVNDNMPARLASMAVNSMKEAGKTIIGSKVLIMGCTYKEDVADARETPVKDLIKLLRGLGAAVYGFDPLVENGERDFGIQFFKNTNEIRKMDCIILTVAHSCFKRISTGEVQKLLNPNSVIIDVRGLFDSPDMRASGIVYKRL